MSLVSQQETSVQLESAGPDTVKALQTRAGAAARLTEIARQLSQELRSGKPRQPGLDASLEQDWGFDSLSRAELLLRIERGFSVHLPERLLGEAGTLRDILLALQDAAAAVATFDTAIEPISNQIAEPAPLDAATLTGVLDWHVARHGDRVHIALWHGDGHETRLSYAQLAEYAHRVAQGIRAADIQPGDHVAIMLPTGEQFFVAFFGALYAGAVPVPIYPPSRLSHIEEHLLRQAGILRNARAVLLIASPEAAPIARLLRLQVETIRAVVSVDELKRGTESLARQTGPSNTALIQYTSGSTGDPKGVVLSHNNVLAPWETR